MNMMKIYSHVQSACAAAPRYAQESEQEELRWVHKVKNAPTADEGSGSAVDKLTQVVEKLLDAVERLSNSFGSSGVDPCVRQPGKPFQNEVYAEYPVEGPYPRNVRNRWYNDQRQDKFPVGAGGGGSRGHRNQYAYGRGHGPNAHEIGAGNRLNNRYHSGYQNSNFRPERSKRGRYGSNWGEYPGMARRGISCFKCGGFGHFQRNCLENTKSVAKHNEVLSLERGGPQHAKDVHDADPLLLPTVPDVVRDPGMVIGESTEGDHGDSVCVDAFRVQRVAVLSAEAASREAARKLTTNRADQVAAEVAHGGAIRQAVGEMAKPATGDKAKPTAGYVDPAGVTVADRRNSASGCCITATDRRCRASGYGVTSEDRLKCATGYEVAAVDCRGGGASGCRVTPDYSWEVGVQRPVRRGSRGWRPSSSRRWERSHRWKLGWRPEFLTSKICTA
ncbi:hypothetical protein DPMN_166029 [Dreissena polymorpha]|uniref:CCHC-type domain-containing protein n=1 Tax=Dreissena polymorpha TaxID=45954 RepID=A0A9D4EXY6_DREPO|nr:hypothetical protein DPMN_166029 [Dreissena polymorpha]